MIKRFHLEGSPQKELGQERKGKVNFMNRNIFVMASAALLLLSLAGAVYADGVKAEATIRLMGAAEAQLPDAVTNPIELPTDLMAAPALEKSKAVEKAKDVLEKATQRRDEGRNGGLNNAEGARAKGAEMAEQAKDNRDTRGRSDPPGPPETPPGPPETPPGN